MARDDFLAALQSIVERNFPKYKGTISEDTEFSTIPGWDSVSHVAMMLDVEDDLGVAIPEEEYFDLTSVSALVGRIETSK